jgi:hypothetical protein
MLNGYFKFNFFLPCSKKMNVTFFKVHFGIFSITFKQYLRQNSLLKRKFIFFLKKFLNTAEKQKLTLIVKKY